jgi:hypothetical protein
MTGVVMLAFYSQNMIAILNINIPRFDPVIIVQYMSDDCDITFRLNRSFKNQYVLKCVLMHVDAVITV